MLGPVPPATPRSAAARSSGPAPRAGAGLLAMAMAMVLASCGFVDRLEYGVPGTSTGMGFDDHTPVALHLEVDPDDLARLYEGDPASDERVDAAWRVGDDGPLRDDPGAALRFRGNTARFLPKKSFNVEFGEHVDAFGSSRTNLVAMYTDPSMLRERLAWEMVAELGHPASATRYVEVFVNGIHEGLYLAVERVDQQMLALRGLPSEDVTLVRDRLRHDDTVGGSVFGADEALLDRVGVTSDLVGPAVASPGAGSGAAGGAALPESAASWLEHAFDWRGDTPDWGAVASLVRWVVDTPAGPEFAAGLEARFDLDVFVDWLAVNEFKADVDSFADDYWLYLDNTDDRARWMVLPWDNDLTFGSHWVPELGTANDVFRHEYPLVTRGRAVAWGNQLFAKALETPAIAERVDERLAELLDAFDPPWFETRVGSIVEAIGDVARAVPGDDAFRLHPGNHHASAEDHDLHVEAVLDFVSLRRSFIEASLASRPGGSQGGAGDGGDAADASDAVAGRDVASVEVVAGQRLLLVDAHGATLAAVEVVGGVAGGREPAEGADAGSGEATGPNGSPGSDTVLGTLSVVVEPSDLTDDVDRVWTFTWDGEPVDVHLDVWYRNHHDDCAMPRCENWFRPGEIDPDTGYPSFVEGQHELVLAQVDDAGVPRRVDASSANPYANRVGGLVTLGPTTRIVVVAR